MIYLFLVFIFFLGASVGSFLNVLIYRFHQRKNIFGRSFCPHCQHQLYWFDLIPIFSFFILRGRCRHCRQKISWQYPIVEMTAGLLFLFSFVRLSSQFSIFNFSAQGGSASGGQFSITLFRDWIFISVMIFVFVYDLKYMLIEDAVVIPAMVAVFFLSLLAGQSLFTIIVGALMSWLFFWLQYYLTKKRGLGEGDLRLGILMGIMFGWPNVLVVILISYIIGGSICLILIMIGKKKLFSEIPLGPFLALGSLITMFFGSRIVDLYFNLLL